MGPKLELNNAMNKNINVQRDERFLKKLVSNQNISIDYFQQMKPNKIF